MNIIMNRMELKFLVSTILAEPAGQLLTAIDAIKETIKEQSNMPDAEIDGLIDGTLSEINRAHAEYKAFKKECEDSGKDFDAEMEKKKNQAASNMGISPDELEKAIHDIKNIF